MHQADDDQTKNKIDTIFKPQIMGSFGAELIRNR